ncbi:activating signal cointegrator 1 complex subunit 3 [Coprinopsis cinerea okayama7|uniref:Activating signal cointegrator 1 complex subunit 3 n=1 Tax=Coprinopsis cinerea (strain Okayama-7 / 130 / ATCC MYA-4618 / FGSC 9003) TaxID=240176 RepID=A8NXW6_COPC7|nr:activating signal cointegrator 1 complex subunit 3 [Coprinopsis cinerea okayama7\|eukprot:XP_001837288.2 activating signal cointegrator 1 complex subunit 3 [Coprinopsis cinerea okayama7\
MVIDDNIASHLSFLIDESNVDKLADKTAFAEWSSIREPVANKLPAVDDEGSDEETVEGLTIAQFCASSSPGQASGSGSAGLIEESLWNDIDRSQWKALLSVLSSKSSDEEVSGEVVEIIGYEKIDLVSTILSRRSEFVAQINNRLDSGAAGPPTRSGPISPEQMFIDSRARIEASLQANASRPLFSGTADGTAAPEILPNVYTSQMSAAGGGSILSQFGSKYALPLGTTHHLYQEYEEFVVPPPSTVPPRVHERPIMINELDPLAKGCFAAYTSLNRIQSIVYPIAHGTNENMLVCAPTGAGKTDVALLTILRVLDQHRDTEGSSLKDSIRRNSFKIIYVAPMKALASEITRKFSKRLRWLSINVRELTGDMQMTKAEIAETQIIVTTPEKWDVVTRKPTGEGELASSIKLLILDEIHLLNEDRGAVIETIVARTLRQVESSQSIVRIVGLSATLPNYVDVAQFLSVSLQKGLFYFDSSFRPVPLEQHFIGVKGKPGSALSKKNMDYVTFQKVMELVQQGHQVMVFVHARKETVKTAMTLREMAMADGTLELFMCDDHPQWGNFRREVGESRNKEMKFLFDNGFGIHHAGMLRSDRNVMEKLFEARAIKVLCCTATLAWGVNLPAHAVVIKGTQVYDASRGAFTDLSVLDVLQIFGRAGRPGLEASGEGYICTTDDKLHHYLEAVTSSVPIESRFQGGMIDALNAEISLGTVATCDDAVQWLGYTYLFVRMRKNPFIYGIDRDTLADDPGLGNKRNELITIAAKRLAETKMIIFDETTQIFNKEFRPKMSEADLLGMLSLSTEFDQIQLREAEMKEIEELMENIPCEVKGGTSTPAGKVNILLQAYISRWDTLNDFALVSDMAYVAQTSGRIIRALLEISISKKWASVTSALLGLSKAIEKRMWPYDHPLEQSQLKFETLNALRRWADEMTVEELAETDSKTLGDLVHLNERQGLAIATAAKQFPSATITYKLQPLANDILKVSLVIARNFTWNPRLHGTSEPFWIWIEDEEGLTIHQLAHLAFHQNTTHLDLDFILPVSADDMPSNLVVRWVSDYWIGAEHQTYVSLENVVMPPKSQSHTPLLELPFIPISDILNPHVASIYGKEIGVLNSIQTQALWSFMHSKEHALLCAPGGSGKSTFVSMILQSLMVTERSRWIIIVAPKRSVAQDLFANLRGTTRELALKVEYPTPGSLLRYKPGTIYVVTPPSLLEALLCRDPTTQVDRLDAVLCDHLEQLDSSYELAVSLLRFATQNSPTRYIGLSDSLNDPSDLAAWLNVDPHSLFSFRPRDREQSLQLHPHTFTIPHSAALFKAMARPAHKAIASTLTAECAIVFVPSRSQCRSIALDLITQCSLDSETARGYLGPDISEESLQVYRCQFQDQELGDFLIKGVGFFHPGIHKQDRRLILQLCVEGVIRVLLVPKDSCWELPMRSPVVVVLGTQYVEVQPESNIRRIREYIRATGHLPAVLERGFTVGITTEFLRRLA